MKFLYDLFPVALFFVAIQIWDIFVATAVAIGATLMQVGWLLVRRKKVQPMRWPEPIWARLNWSWVGFFAFMGCANLYVAFNYSEKIWATFKLFGGMGLMFLFVIVQSLVLAKYMQDDPH